MLRYRDWITMLCNGLRHLSILIFFFHLTQSMRDYILYMNELRHMSFKSFDNATKMQINVALVGNMNCVCDMVMGSNIYFSFVLD